MKHIVKVRQQLGGYFWTFWRMDGATKACLSCNGPYTTPDEAWAAWETFALGVAEARTRQTVAPSPANR